MAVAQLKMPEGLRVRPSISTDKAFLESLFRSTREDLLQIDGERDFIESIIELQYRAQSQGYGEQFPNAMYFVIEKHNEKIGKATLDFGHNEIRVLDIAFLPEARGKGLGEAVLRAFMHCAQQVMVPLSLSVLTHNYPAKKLYYKLGFQIENIQLPYEWLIWYPQRP